MPSAGSQPVSSSPGAGAGEREHRTRVLYVEASLEQGARLRSAIEARGFEVDEVTDAHDAIAHATAAHPDLVLIDVHSNGTTANELARELRSAGSLARVPLVAHGGAKEREEYLGAGFDGFLNEPLDDSTLFEQLRRYLGDQQRGASSERVHDLEREMALTTGENNRLRDQARVRGEFMRNLAHELATPLTPVVGYLKLLRSGRLGPLTERQMQVLDAMAHATERLGHSIDNLVDYASLETGKYRVLPVEFDASPMVDEVVQELHARARSKHVRVDVRKPEHTVVRGDQKKLRQALTNVLDNALKASPHGGRILIDLQDAKDRISFAVYDQGPGLPADVQRVAEGTELLHTDERAGGVGLGLPVARQIVTAHGGQLLLESPPKEQPDVRDLFPGSRVGFWIPREVTAG